MTEKGNFLNSILGPTIILLLFLLSLTSFAGEIALTFDDAPRSSGKYFSGAERANQLIKSLNKAGVSQVAFFCNSLRLDSEGRERLLTYANQGHVLANHSHSHPDIRSTSVSEFIKDVQKGHDHLSGLPNYKNWFRFPFLQEGASESDRDTVRKYLKNRGFRNGYVTVDTYDWYMDASLQKAVENKMKIRTDGLCAAYVEILWDGVQFYNQIARSVLKRSPKHVLLLHENDLAALCVGDLVEFIRKQGWKIISPTEAYSDPIASVEPKTLYLNQGQIAAIAKDKGFSGPLVTKWENAHEIDAEFSRRKVFE